jgi:5-methylcytosine-specific restriction enzyme A
MTLRRTRIKSRSNKETARLRAYNRARGVVFERANGYCEANTPQCRGAMDQVHHRKGRDGDLIDNVDLLLGVCWACHNHIHANPALSYEQGWLVKRNGENND